MQNQESLDVVIKRVCTNPLFTFVPLPILYSNTFLPTNRTINRTIQGFIADMIYTADFFPETSFRKLREMTDAEQSSGFHA